MFNCTSLQSKDTIPPHDTFKISSKIIGEKRVINVWMPEIHKNSTEKFPVLYMADGGIKEDFPHIANTISQLIQSNKISPIILVGIENTQRRRDLTGFTEVEEDKKIAPVVGGSEKFRAFIKEELFPEIEKRYRTSEKRGIIGESASGLFVTETLFLAPEMFDFYIAFDPSLWWNNHFLVRSAQENLKNLPTKEIRFWFAGSNAPDISPHTKALANILNLRTQTISFGNTLTNPRKNTTQFSERPKKKPLFGP